MACSLDELTNVFTQTDSNIADVGLSGVTLKTNAINNIINNLRDYIKVNLPKYIDCNINSYGNKIQAGNFDSTIEIIKNKLLDEINHVNLSSLDNLKNQFDTKITNGDYDDLINKISNKIIMTTQDEIQTNSFTKLLEDLRQKFQEEINKIQIPQHILLIGGIIIVVIIFLLLLLLIRCSRKN